jgi:hypothetical protein
MEVQREFGNYPLSIGTSLAIEGLVGTHPEHTNTIQPKAFEQLWVNLPTLVRNYLSACSTEDLSHVDLHEGGDHLMDELYHLQEILNGLEAPLELVIYHQTLDEVKWLFPHAPLKEPRTERQQHQHYCQDYLYRLLLEVFARRELPLTTIKGVPEVVPRRVLMLTHHAHHLLWVFRFSTLMLLESHTGKIKERNEWGSKLHGVKSEDHFPLTRTLIQLLGEGTLLAGIDAKLRREVRTIGMTAKWHSLTTDEKVRHDLLHHASPDLKAWVKTLS